MLFSFIQGGFREGDNVDDISRKKFQLNMETYIKKKNSIRINTEKQKGKKKIMIFFLFLSNSNDEQNTKDISKNDK